MSPMRLGYAAARSAARRWSRGLTPARAQRWHLAEAAIDDARLPHSARVLDVGCADGLLAGRLAVRRPDWSVVATDLSEAVLRAAADQPLHARRGPLWVRSDATRLPVADGVFDLVLALECLAEIPGDRAVVAELARVVAPGGAVLVHVPEAGWQPVLPGSPRSWRREVRHGYSEGALVSLLREAGLEPVRVVGSMRTIVMLVQEIAERSRSWPPAARLAIYPVASVAVWTETRLGSPGAARGLFVLAVRPRP